MGLCQRGVIKLNLHVDDVRDPSTRYRRHILRRPDSATHRDPIGHPRDIHSHSASSDENLSIRCIPPEKQPSGNAFAAIPFSSILLPGSACGEIESPAVPLAFCCSQLRFILRHPLAPRFAAATTTLRLSV